MAQQQQKSNTLETEVGRSQQTEGQLGLHIQILSKREYYVHLTLFSDAPVFIISKSDR